MVWFGQILLLLSFTILYIWSLNNSNQLCKYGHWSVIVLPPPCFKSIFYNQQSCDCYTWLPLSWLYQQWQSPSSWHWRCLGNGSRNKKSEEADLYVWNVFCFELIVILIVTADPLQMMMMMMCLQIMMLHLFVVSSSRIWYYTALMLFQWILVIGLLNRKS